MFKFVILAVNFENVRGNDLSFFKCKCLLLKFLIINSLCSFKCVYLNYYIIATQ